MITLGIESTAHTFGASIVKGKKVGSNVRHSYTTKKGGMIPAQLGEHHIKHFCPVIQEALTEANVSIKDVDIVAYSSSPGMGHALRIGAAIAKSISLQHNLPLVPVNHCIAHLEIGRLMTPAKDPVLLYCSGANTQIIAYEGGKYRIFGETLDIGIGNFLDTFGRQLELGFPAGPAIEQLAQKGKEFIELPYSVKGMDVAFSGIQTNLKQKIQSKKYTKEDLCMSAQETVFAMLIEVSERAMAHCGKKELLLGGGVACNKQLQAMAEQMCKDRGGKSFVPENQFLIDNAGMIAWTGALMYEAGIHITPEKGTINPYERTDQVTVTWR